MPAVKSNRPVNLSLGQVLDVNLKSPVAIASILHRISGLVLFLLIPVILYALQQSLASEQGFQSVFDNIAVRFLVWVFVAGILYHFIAGMKHLFADMGMAEELQSGRTASWISLAISAVAILVSFVWVML